jgi:hypothetical protein
VPDYIKTVQCYPIDAPAGEPIITLGSGQQLLFSFDDLSKDVSNYSYRIIHCTPDMKPSNLSHVKYISGFNSLQMDDYAFSFNTHTEYTHYQLFIPNENMQLKLSGNYMLEIFKDEEPDSVIIAQPFSVVENKVNISAQFKTPTDPQLIETSRELSFVVSYDNLFIQNPMKEVVVYVTQNQDPNTRREFSPTFSRPHQLIYGNGVNNIFDGLAPFRNFKDYSLVYFTQYVRNIIQDGEGNYHVVLQPGRPYKSYVPLPNLSGGYEIKAENIKNSATEAEYMTVHFAVHSQELPDAEVYVYGKFSGWQLLPSLKMTYDPVNLAYVGDFMLKQGDYDYMFAVHDRDKQIDLTTLQGNFYQNRNTYNIRCYLYDSRMGYYRFVGYSSVIG